MPENEIIPPPPDPPAVVSVGAEAVEAAACSLYEGVYDGKWSDLKGDDFDRGFYTDWAAETLAAALPHLRAQVLAEVDAALRDDDRFAWWAHQRNDDAALYIDTDKVADYLRDTLTPEGDRP